jgi:hypothetical protein
MQKNINFILLFKARTIVVVNNTRPGARPIKYQIMILDDSINILQPGVPSTVNPSMFRRGRTDSKGISAVTYEMEFSKKGWLYLQMDSCIIQNEGVSPIDVEVASKYEFLKNGVYDKSVDRLNRKLGRM